LGKEGKGPPISMILTQQIAEYQYVFFFL
jgi:hypothetical protein